MIRLYAGFLGFGDGLTSVERVEEKQRERLDELQDQLAALPAYIEHALGEEDDDLILAAGGDVKACERAIDQTVRRHMVFAVSSITYRRFGRGVLYATPAEQIEAVEQLIGTYAFPPVSPAPNAALPAAGETPIPNVTALVVTSRSVDHNTGARAFYSEAAKS